MTMNVHHASVSEDNMDASYGHSEKPFSLDDDSSIDSDDDCSSSFVSSDLSSYSLNHHISNMEEENTTEEDRNAGLFLSMEMVQMLRLSTSEGNMLPADVLKQMTPSPKQQEQQLPRRNSAGAAERAPASKPQQRMVYAVQTKSALASHSHFAASEADIPKPRDTLEALLKAEGRECQYSKSSDVPHLFTKGCVSSYSLELMNAVRQNDIALIRKLYEAGNNLQSCNRFGESIVHAAARRGNLEVLMVLKELAGVSLHVACQQGRTPLHDACWTGHPDFSVIRYLMEDFPASLYLTDCRGFTPLDFIPKEAHEEWNVFLKENLELVAPREALA